MEEEIPKDVMKEAKEYFSISARLPKINLSHFRNHCKKLNVTPSERIRELVLQDINKPPKKFLSGANLIKYNKTNNSFSWIVKLDTGQEVEVLNNLSDDFLKNLKKEIEQAVKERNDWVHQTSPDSVHVPKELIGGKE